MKNTFNTSITGLGLAALLLFSSCNGSNAQKQESNTSSETTTDQDEGFQAMFQSGSLAGWTGDSTYWSMQGDVLVGEITADRTLTNNTFLIWEGGQPADFILITDFKISPDGNSGVNYRSERLTDIPFALRGYQADIDGQNRYTGQNYEERKRTTLAYKAQRTTIVPSTEENPGESLHNAWTNMQITDSLATDEELNSLIKANDWNELKIIAEGNKLSHYINGKLVSETIDLDTEHSRDSGEIGVQVHVGPPMKVEYRNMRIKQL